MIANNHLVLAAAGVEESALFGIVQNFFTVLGVFIVVIVLWKVIKSVVGGKAAEAAKIGIPGVILAAICFDLMLPVNFVQSLSGLASSIFDLISDIASGSDTPAPGSGSPFS